MSRIPKLIQKVKVPRWVRSGQDVPIDATYLITEPKLTGYEKADHWQFDDTPVYEDFHLYEVIEERKLEIDVSKPDETCETCRQLCTIGPCDLCLIKAECDKYKAALEAIWNHCDINNYSHHPIASIINELGLAWSGFNNPS